MLLSELMMNIYHCLTLFLKQGIKLLLFQNSFETRRTNFIAKILNFWEFHWMRLTATTSLSLMHSHSSFGVDTVKKMIHSSPMALVMNQTISGDVIVHEYQLQTY